MDAQKTGVITLIKSAIDGKSYPLPEGFDLPQAVQTAIDHRIVALIYYGALNCGISKNCEPMQVLFRYIVAIMTVDAQQNHEIQRVCSAFDENRIDYLPMKGTVLKKLYPKSEMRTMGDADILIRKDQYPQIQPIMESLGFTFRYESDHELVWKRNRLELELHKRVMTTYNKDFYQYFGTGWRFARKVTETGTRYDISDEDFYIYMFVHFTKHYRVSGIGIKHLVDLWVYRCAKRELNDRYINAELKKLKLDVFHGHILETLDMWFHGGAQESIPEYITDVIFTSGEYGLAETAQAARILRDSKQTTGSVKRSRFNAFLARIFLPYRGMCIKYPVLYKVPILLPFLWIYRGITTVLFRADKIKAYLKHDDSMDEKIDQHQQALNMVGLDFYPEERET